MDNTERLTRLQALDRPHLRVTAVEDLFPKGRHPFTVGPRHVAHAANQHGGLLGRATLEAVPCAAPRCGRDHSDPVHHSERGVLLLVSEGVTRDEFQDWAATFKPLAAELEIYSLGLVPPSLSVLRQAGLAE